MINENYQIAKSKWIKDGEDPSSIDKWIEIFKKTSDWDGTKTFNIIDITPPPPTPAEIAVEEAKRVKRADNYQKINDLKGKNLTTPEMKVAVEAILEVLGL